MPKKDITNSKDSKEKSEKVLKKDLAVGKDIKGKDKEAAKEVKQIKGSNGREGKSREKESPTKVSVRCFALGFLAMQQNI